MTKTRSPRTFGRTLGKCIRSCIPSARALALAVAWVLMPLGADAQVRGGMGGQRPQQPERAVRLYAIGGYAQPDLDGLNARLASLAEPYSPIGEDLVLYGGGLHGRAGRFILGLEVAMMQSIEDAEMGDARRAALSGMNGSIVAGISIAQTGGFDLYPMLQLGGAAVSLEVQERDDPTWDEVLADPGRSSALSSMLFYGAAGLGMDYTFRNGFFLGVRGSWGFTPPSDRWTDEKGEVLGGPEIDLSGPTVRLMLGLGGR